MTEQLTIARIGHRGDGIADTNVGPVYVPYALPGETVTVEKVPGHPDRRHLLHVDNASPERIAPVCPHFGQCGGCAMQHWSMAEYHAWKRNLVVEALEHAGLVAPVEPLIDAHGKGRRRAVLHARRGHGDILEVGFAAPRTHHIIAIDKCPILAPGLNGAVPAAWAIAELVETDQQAARHSRHRDRHRHGCRRARLRPAQRPRARRRSLNWPSNTGWRASPATANWCCNANRLLLKIGRAFVPLPPGAFLQATAEGEATLARLVTAHIGAGKKIKRVADLFSGIGTFALRLAETARVTAIDSEGLAIKALQQAVAKTSGLKADRSADPRPVPQSCDGVGTEGVRRGRVRSAAPGRRDAGARTGVEQSAGGGRGVM